MSQPDWREVVLRLLKYEAMTRHLHRPPATPCILRCRDQYHVGSLQGPLLADFPAVSLLSINRKEWIVPEFLRILRNLDPGRLFVTADEAMDLSTSNFHIVHWEGNQVGFMTTVETEAINASSVMLNEINLSSKGQQVVVQPVIHQPYGRNN